MIVKGCSRIETDLSLSDPTVILASFCDSRLPFLRYGIFAPVALIGERDQVGRLEFGEGARPHSAFLSRPEPGSVPRT